MPPTALISSLESVRRRVRSLSVAYGLGIVIAAAVGCLLATVLLDYFLNLPPVPRIIMMLLSLAGIGYVLARWVVKPALAKLGLSDVAGKLENAFPAFDDRLRSTVDFITKGTPGSDVMKNRVVAEATELAHRFNLNAAIETKPVWHSSLAAAGALLAVALLATVLGPEYLSPAISRLLTPFGGQAWPKRVEIAMVNPLPQRVPVGQRINVQIRLTKGDRASREARMFYQYGDGRVETEIMSRAADGIYSASLDARAISSGNGAMRVWMEAGDDKTDPRTIGIVARLAVTGMQLMVTPPPYVTDAAPTTVQLDAAPATVTYGSSLSIAATFNKPLDSQKPVTVATDQASVKLPAIAWSAPSGASVAGKWMARESAVFQVHAFDTDGFANQDLTDYQVIVRPDESPTIQITRPARNEECTPQAVIALRGIAEDDFGIKSLKLLAVKMADKPAPFAPIDLIKDGKPAEGVTWNPIESSGEMRRWQIDFPWDLARLDSAPLKPGDAIEYCLQVQDNFNFEGKTHDPVLSGRYRITIMSQDQFTSLMTDLVGQVRDQLIEIRNGQRSLKDQTADLRSQTQKQPEFTKADRQAAQSIVGKQTTEAAQTKTASSKLNDLVARMEQNKSTAQELKDIASAVKDDLNQVAEHPMKDATSQIGDASNQKANPKDDAAQQKAAEERNAQMDKASANQQAAAEKLDQLVSKIGEVGGLPKTIEQLKAILAQQQAISKKSDEVGMRNLGKQPEQMNAQDRKAQQDAAAEQNALSDKTQKAVEQMQASAKKAEKSDPSASQAMKQASQTAQEQNVTPQMKSAAAAQQQNQQSKAQQAQAQAEVGLQMMIRQLEEAQQRKLEELAKQLADLQEQIASLIRQQAALNYSNMSAQGGDVLAKADPKLLDGLIEKAEWTKGALPPIPDMGTQTRLQEQAERNTRNIAKTAESLQDGAIIVAALNRAADRMSRAIVFLRDEGFLEPQRLARAYDPPQVEALAALLSAKDAVDQQADKAAQALNQQKKDSIRAAFAKILEAQKKIDVDTAAIDKAPHGDDGQLAHKEATRLAQLPGEQAGLADRSGKLGEDLVGLGGIVYVWANKDIVDSMKSVKTELAKPQTGVTTQAEQTRIEEQLAAMIDSLKTKPKQSAFAKPKAPPGGGAGQPGSPPLPPEAELRLMRQLQAAVNKSTKTISDQGNPQDPVLIALGGRQGELRTLLDQVLQKSSHGQNKLGPEPDAADKLPEEATTENIDTQELQQALLNDDGSPNSDQEKKSLNLVGQRMARSKQRLALDKDPGKVTQEIQKRILIDMDQLIEMARSEQSQGKPPPGKGQQQQAQAPQPGAPQPGNQQGQRPAGTTPAAQSVPNRDTNTAGGAETDIAQTLKEWGGISPRKRAAVIEAASEKPIEKFKTFIDDYYRALGEKATEQPK